MKILVILALFYPLLFINESVAEINNGRYYSPDFNVKMSVYSSRPRRLIGNLRQENLNDIEVREIVRATREVMPGVIVTIDGARSGCPCEDGPDCTAQVWVVDYEPEKSQGLMLSKIEEKWTIGPVQSWWLLYYKLIDQLRMTRLSPDNTDKKIERLNLQISELWEDQPRCSQLVESDN